MGEIPAGAVSSDKALWSLWTFERSKEEEGKQIKRRKWHKQWHRYDKNWVFSMDSEQMNMSVVDEWDMHVG